MNTESIRKLTHRKELFLGEQVIQDTSYLRPATEVRQGRWRPAWEGGASQTWMSLWAGVLNLHLKKRPPNKDYPIHWDFSVKFCWASRGWGEGPESRRSWDIVIFQRFKNLSSQSLVVSQAQRFLGSTVMEAWGWAGRMFKIKNKFSKVPTAWLSRCFWRDYSLSPAPNQLASWFDQIDQYLILPA